MYLLQRYIPSNYIGFKRYIEQAYAAAIQALVQQAQASLDQGVLTGLAENRVAFVARGDVAPAAAGILIGDGHAGAIYNATGPERLSGNARCASASGCS